MGFFDSLVKNLQGFGGSIAGGIGNTIGSTVKVAGIIPNEARAGFDLLRGNKQGAINAFNQAGQGVHTAEGFFQALPRAIAQVGLTATHLPGVGQSYTPGSTAEKLLFGDQPVNSLQKEYTQSRAAGNSIGTAVGDVTLAGLGDVLALKGGVQGATKGADLAKGAIESPVGQRLVTEESGKLAKPSSFFDNVGKSDRGKLVYRAGQPFDASRVTEEGISVSPSQELTRKKFQAFWDKGPIEELYISPEAKIMPFNEIPENLYKKLPSGEILPTDLVSNGNYQKIIALAKQKGYDAVDLRRFGEGEIRIMNPDILQPVLKNPITRKFNESTSTSQETATQQAIIRATSGKQRLINLGKGLNPTAKSDLLDYFRQNSAADTHAIQVGQQLENLPSNSDVAAVAKQFQANGDRSGLLGTVQQILDEQQKKEVAAGVPTSYRDNYLPVGKIFEQPKSEITAFEQGFGNKAIAAKGFTKEALYPTIQDYLDNGFTIKQGTRLSDAIMERVRQGDRAINFQTLVDKGTKEGYLSDRAAKGQRPIEGTSFYADPGTARALNNYIQQPADVLRKSAHVASVPKRWAFALQGIPDVSGIPGLKWTKGFGSGVQVHDLNVAITRAHAARDIGGIPLTGYGRELLYSLKDALFPHSAEANLKSNLDWFEKAQRAGSNVTLNTTNDLGRIYAKDSPDTLMGRIINTADQIREYAYENPTFDKVIPNGKLRILQQEYKALIKKGVPDKEALRRAGDRAQEASKDINFDTEFRNKNYQAALSSTFFAPVYNEANLRSAGKIAKSFTTQLNNPDYAPYRQIAKSLAGAVIAADYINYHTSGHHMWDNDPGKKFAIQIGNDSDAKYLGIFGSFGNLVGDAEKGAELATKGDLSGLSQTVRGRLSTPLGLAVNAVTNTNNFGTPITSSQKTPGENLANLGNTLAQSLAPSSVSKGSQLAQGNTTAGKFATTLTGLPVTYASARTAKAGPTVSGRSTSIRVKKGRKTSTGRRRVSTGRIRTKRAKISTGRRKSVKLTKTRKYRALSVT